MEIAIAFGVIFSVLFGGFAFFYYKKNKTMPEPLPDPVPNTVAPEPKYKWDNPELVRHSIRVICDEYGLTWHQKDLMCDIARCESGFLPTATLKNSAKSIDRGLFQINGYYHPEATEENAYNPEWNTRWAIKAFQNGKVQAYWSASKPCWNRGSKYDDLLV